MSTEREPTVIERMAVAHWTEHCSHLGSDEEIAPYSWWQESMLAAVRELYWCQIERGEKHHCMAAACMLEVIEDHERRAGGKDQ